MLPSSAQRRERFFQLKVSKSRKKNIISSIPPKATEFLHFFALASESGSNQEVLFFVPTPFKRLGQKNLQNFVGFLEYGRMWHFAFEIY
jgi:hypothetical protein